ELNLPQINTIICTDLYSLYECLVKLGTTKEKRLIINIIALRELYKPDNLANAFIKRDNNSSLIRFINTNKAHIQIDKWVEREE
ncbi:hypothetical protein K469DRAFT_553496, partial [Zopfia rhizophila CBS 207.26]